MISINVLLMVSRIKYFFIEIFVLIVYRSVNKVFFYITNALRCQFPRYKRGPCLEYIVGLCTLTCLV